VGGEGEGGGRPAMAAEEEVAGGPLGHVKSFEGELVRRNREIAQVRDQLRQREAQVEEWKGRHNELLVRLSDLDGELTKLRSKVAHLDSHEASGPGSACVGQASHEAALARASAAEGRSAELEGRLEAEAEAWGARLEDATRRHSAELAEAAAQAVACRADLEARLAAERLAGQRAQAQLVAEQGALREQLAAEHCGRERAEAELVEAQANMRKQLAQHREEVSAAASTRLEELEAQLAGERRSLLTQLAGFEAQVARERSARLDAEARCESAGHERGEAEQQVAELTAELRDCRARIDSDARGRDEAAEQLSKLASRLQDVKARNDVAMRERDDVAQQLARTTAELEASKAEVSRAVADAATLREERDDLLKKLRTDPWTDDAQDSARTSLGAVGSLAEQRLRSELREAAEQQAQLERELLSVDMERSSRLEAHVRILQSENEALRTEAGVLRQKHRELQQGLTMKAEEEVEAASETARLRAQLEETRRARSLDMTALVKKLCRGPEVAEGGG